MQPVAGMTVTVTAFRFVGNTLLDNDKLTSLVAGYLNRPASFADLQKVAAVVAEAYRQAGWIVRVYLPQQDVQGGVITIQIVEAVFGSVKIEGVPGKRVSMSRIERSFEAQQPRGAPLGSNAIDRALLLADDLPGVAVTGSLKEGDNARETDLIVRLTDEPLITGAAYLDNSGSRSTGSDQLGASINLNSLLGYGDLIGVSALHTRGSDYLRLGGTLPAGYEGWRIGANASHLSYRLVAPEFVALNGSGSSGSIGLEAAYPLIRSRLQNLYLNLNYDRKSFDNLSVGTTRSNYYSDVLSVALNGNLYDNLGGGGANSGNLTLSEGNNVLGSLQAGENAALNGSYSKLRYNFNRMQVVTDTVSLYGAVAGQESNGKNLDSSEKFYLGGSSGVRAYPTSEGGGSTGILVNLELRWRLPQGFLLTGFYDHGHIANYDGSKSYGLKGAGLALAWQAGFGLNLKASWAHRIGSNPNPTANGNDQDGSLARNRFWLIAFQTF
jgi:hemolysin activation/secretion protein